MMTTEKVEAELDVVLPPLPTNTSDGLARETALREFVNGPRFATLAVTYVSRGTVLVIGDRERALAAANSLKETGLEAFVAINDLSLGERFKVGVASKDLMVAEGAISELSGHLGKFLVHLRGKQGLVNLAREMQMARDHFDLVLDLQAKPLINIALPPPGYYAPKDDVAFERAMANLPDMVGEYEKPKYFDYDPDICAHSARGLMGCTRCIDACPTNAISSVIEQIAVDPYLCQGGGSCATACPTGAIRYMYPPVGHLIDGLRGMLRAYRERGGTRPGLLFYSEWGRERIVDWGERLPESVIPIEVEDVGSVGLDVWLPALALGAHQVWLLMTDGTPVAISREIDDQLRVADEMLTGMGYAANRVAKISASDGALPKVPDEPLADAASFAGFDDKRTNIRLAMDHLYQHAPNSKKFVSLTAPAPFGEIKVNRDTCTLCMSCAAVCPAQALSDGEDMPRLLFIEGNCVQCGLCATACPEDAIQLVPRYAYDPDPRSRPRTLNEEQPFHCISCGKPFATQSVMTRMREKLTGHWMFRDPAQMRRLEMCEDCRIEDLYLKSGGIEVYDKPVDTDTSGGSQ